MDHKINCLAPQVIGGTCTCEPDPLTILDLAYFIENIPEGDGVGGEVFDRLGLPIIGGCQACGATVAAYNACPSTTGYLRCREGCISDLGWVNYQEALEALFAPWSIGAGE